jgi:hypothetical protein
MSGRRPASPTGVRDRQPAARAVPTDARPDVSVVVVNWNTGELLRQCLRSIVDEAGVEIAGFGETAGHMPDGTRPPLAVEVIVVDNASDDGSVAAVQAEFPQVRLIANRSNTGFAAANNQAIAQARGRYLFLLNPDAYLLPGALPALAHFLNRHPEAAAAGPNVLNPDGTWQAAVFRFPTLWDLFCEAVFLSVLWPHSRLFARKELGGFNRDHVREVDWIQGCALAIRREVWQAVGPFDEGYWMYVEELDWCRRAHQLGYRLFFTPEARVVHYGRRAVARARASVLPLGFRSHFRYFRKFDGRTTELAVRAITLLQMGLRAAISVAMVVVSTGTERRRWRENLRAYAAVMREALRFHADAGRD